jgi:uncharacterized membrane protein
MVGIFPRLFGPRFKCTNKERDHSMESQQYQRLNPLAFAIAAGVAAIVVSLLIGLPTMGFGGMMNGHYGGYGGQGWMMGGYGNGSVVGFGIMWLVGVLVAALAGAIVAWVYNAVHATGSKEAAGSGPEGESQLPSSR